ncbi:MAG: hypothetical protein AAF458_03280 [Pseudomonadota bacterium]
MKYRVHIDTNYHQMDTSARPLLSEYDSYEEALAGARAHIDEMLADSATPGIGSEELLQAFITRDEVPFIVPDDSNPPFDGRAYALRRCREMAGAG